MDLFKELYSPSPGTSAKFLSFLHFKGLGQHIKVYPKRKLVQLKMLGFND